jgi:hypothetical protein
MVAQRGCAGIFRNAGTNAGMAASKGRSTFGVTCEVVGHMS